VREREPRRDDRVMTIQLDLSGHVKTAHTALQVNVLGPPFARLLATRLIVQSGRL
jgi:hypothetical protein